MNRFRFKRNRRPRAEQPSLQAVLREWPLNDAAEQERYQVTPAGRALLASIAREDAALDVSVHTFCPSFCACKDTPEQEEAENAPWPDGSRFPYPDRSTDRSIDLSKGE